MNEWRDPTSYHEGIRLDNMKKGDTIYIKKMNRGYAFHYGCEFISYKKGIVTAKVKVIHLSYDRTKVGSILTTRPDNCYVWGQSKTGDRYLLNYNHCQWFNKKGVLQ